MSAPPTDRCGWYNSHAAACQSRDLVGIITSACVHEHVTTLRFCAAHYAAILRTWEKEGTLLCVACQECAQPHRCEARKLEKMVIT